MQGVHTGLPQGLINFHRVDDEADIRMLLSGILDDEGYSTRQAGDTTRAVQELATAVQYGANIIQLVFNNSSLGTIRMHQERDYPERVIGTDLVNPDFAALARAYGALGLRVERSGDFRAALAQALQADRPAVIDIVVDKENLAISATLSEIRAGKLAPKRQRPPAR